MAQLRAAIAEHSEPDLFPPVIPLMMMRLSSLLPTLGLSVPYDSSTLTSEHDEIALHVMQSRRRRLRRKNRLLDSSPAANYRSCRLGQSGKRGSSNNSIACVILMCLVHQFLRLKTPSSCECTGSIKSSDLASVDHAATVIGPFVLLRCSTRLLPLMPLVWSNQSNVSFLLFQPQMI
jgi:hypothetical protein